MPFLFPLLAILIWAANTVVSKAAAGVLDPAAISFYRWVIAALALSPFCLPQLWPRRADIRPWLGKLLVLSLLGMVLYQCLAYYAAHSTSATNMGVIGSLLPLLTL
ncbi:DMT family transporter, partial [Aeromonas caviae]